MEENNLKDITSLIPKKHNHHHYWIEGGILFESYKTIRGMRYMSIKEVPGMPDEDFCTKECLEYIAKEYYS